MGENRWGQKTVGSRADGGKNRGLAIAGRGGGQEPVRAIDGGGKSRWGKSWWGQEQEKQEQDGLRAGKVRAGGVRAGESVDFNGCTRVSALRYLIYGTTNQYLTGHLPQLLLKLHCV